MRSWHTVKAPHEPVGVAPFQLTLHDEGLAIDDELIAGTRVRDLAARSSKIALSAWMRVSPKLRILSGRRAIIRTDTGSPPAGA